MNILITNDDGIYAEGIKVLAEEASNFGNIYVVAPVEEKSACGHGITVRSPMKLHTKELFSVSKASYALDGTPADCVKLANQFLIPGNIDLVLSGVNRGSNIGTDVIYSGTVAGAIEGYINGISSIAFSIDGTNIINYDLTRKAIRDVITDKIINNRSKQLVCFNVNIPNIEMDDFRGYQLTRLGKRFYNNEFIKRQDPWGNDYFWLGGEVQSEPLDDITYDTAAVYQKYISVTPLNLDLTDMEFFK